MRSPNTQCSVCGVAIYRRPHELKSFKNVYCSKTCLWQHRGLVALATCPTCGTTFKPERNRQKHCCKSCANSARRGSSYSKLSSGNKSQRRLAVLKNTFGFETCMVEGCSYSRTFDIHRVVPGSEGGKYEIGNMFAICPNDHAEETRGLIRLVKVNDFTLRREEITEAIRNG